MMMAARLTEESQENRPEHVECRHARRDNADPEEQRMPVMRSDKDRILGKVAGRKGKSGDRQGSAEQGSERDRRLLAQSAHVLKVLFATQGVDHRSCAEEQQRFEESVRHDVEDAHRECADTARQEHVAKLRHGGVRVDLFDVVLNQTDGRRHYGRQQTDDRDHIHGDIGVDEQLRRATHHVYARRDHRGRVDQRRDRRRTSHRVRQPHIQWNLSRFTRRADK